MAGAFPANATAHADGILLTAVSSERTHLRANSGPPTSAAGAVQVDVYVDFHSGPCQRFEAVVGSTVDEMLGAGEITLAYHPVAVLDALSSFGVRHIDTPLTSEKIWRAMHAAHVD